VWGFAAASSLGVLDTVFEWATGFLIELWLHVLWINGTTSNEQVERFQDKHALDLASAVLAESGLGGLIDWVESVAVEDQVGFSSSGAWQVLHRPWHASVVASSIFKIEHAAVIAIMQLLAKMIDTVDWLSFTSSMIFLKVAPASVLVESIKVLASENLTDSSGLRSIGLDKRSDISVCEITHLIFHGLKAGIGVANQENTSHCTQLHLVRA